MSTIIGIVDNGRVWIGTDSYATTTNGERRRIICKKSFVNSGYLISFIGSIRAGQSLRPEYFKAPKEIYQFPDKIIAQFEKCGCLGTDSDNQTYITESSFLIANSHGKLFELLSDFQINEIEDYTSLGSGSSFALGSLYTTEAWKDPKKRIITALKASGVYDMSTGPPYKIEKFL